MYLKGQKLEVALHSLHREYKNVQKSVLTNVNIQRTGKTSLQMFVYFIFDGSFICRFLYIFRPSSVPQHSISPRNKRNMRWLSTTYICRFYILHRKVIWTTLYQFVITCTYFKFVILSLWWWLCDKRARRTCFGRVPRRWCESHRLQKLLACPL